MRYFHLMRPRGIFNYYWTYPDGGRQQGVSDEADVTLCMTIKEALAHYKLRRAYFYWTGNHFWGPTYLTSLNLRMELTSRQIYGIKDCTWHKKFAEKKGLYSEQIGEYTYFCCYLDKEVSYKFVTEEPLRSEQMILSFVVSRTLASGEFAVLRECPTLLSIMKRGKIQQLFILEPDIESNIGRLRDLGLSREEKQIIRQYMRQVIDCEANLAVFEYSNFSMIYDKDSAASATIVKTAMGYEIHSMGDKLPVKSPFDVMMKLQQLMRSMDYT